jgi:hypothetical protein
MTVHTTTELSKSATIGLGVGLGGFVAAMGGGFFLFRWWAKRKKQSKHKRAPSIVISAPLEARQNDEPDAKRADSPTKDMRELDGVGKPGVAGSLDHSTPTNSTRSPVSPWTPATATTGTTIGTSTTPIPNIYEMMGSEPVEMAAAPAGAEMAGSNTAQELSSAVESMEPSQPGHPGQAGQPSASERPFSYTQTPVEAFLTEKKPEGVEPGENRV